MLVEEFFQKQTFKGVKNMPLRLEETIDPEEEVQQSSISMSSKGVLQIDASDNSPDLARFLDLLENPCKYKGRVIYLLAIGPTQRPDPFLWADKFYFNEGCEWHESPFSFKMDNL